MRFTKQFIYGAGFLIVVALIVWGIVSAVYNPTPTCTDGKRNQGEADTDCGGPCTPCALKTLKPIQVQSKKVFKAANGFGYAFEAVNRNGDWAAANVSYTVLLEDSFGKTLHTYSAETFVYAGELKYIVEPYLSAQAGQDGNFQNIASIDVQFGEPKWESKNQFSKPDVDTQDIRTAKINNQMTVTGKLVNKLSVAYKNPKIIAVVFNRTGEIIGASKTELREIKDLETKQFSIPFPKELDIYTPNTQPQIQFLNTLKAGDTGAEVTKLQQVLLEFGFIQRDPTGFYDVITQDAMRDMQEKNDLEPTGEFDEPTRQFINGLLQNQVEQPSQQQLDTSVDTSKTKVFVEISR